MWTEIFLKNAVNTQIYPNLDPKDTSSYFDEENFPIFSISTDIEDVVKCLYTILLYLVGHVPKGSL